MRASTTLSIPFRKSLSSSPSAAMLRRKLSAGLLRAAANAQQTAPTALPASPIQQQTKNLASAVLLSSARNWREETVTTLKSELKRRGLSQQGNKAALVARLSSAEASSLLPPVPPLPRSTTTAISSPPTSRNLSTTPARQLPPKSKAPKPTGNGNSSETVTSTGPQISSQRTEAPKVAPVTPEEVTVAPGLPATKDAGKGVKGLGVKLPSPPADSEIDQIIPLTPDNFRSSQKTDTTKSSTSDAPKVVTVASASTHHAGGPTHSLHESHDAHSLELSTKAEEFINELSSIAKGYPSLVSAANSVLTAPGKAWSSAGLSKSLLPEVAVPKLEAKEEEYKPPSRGLNDEEKRGLWVLGGIVGLGLLFGGSKKASKDKHEHGKHAKHAAEAAGSAVKGDAEWAKASGAGVVGHGARKQ